MTTFDPQLVQLLVLMTVAAGMILLGRRYNMLAEPRRNRCAACGRDVEPRGRCDCLDSP